MQKLTPVSLPRRMYSTFVDYQDPTEVVGSCTKSKCADFDQLSSQTRHTEQYGLHASPSDSPKSCLR